MKKVAVTGGLSSGKSTVCRMFRNLGAFVISADDIVHKLLSRNAEIGRQVGLLLGDGVFKDGRLDRMAIAREVFSHPQKLKPLESVLHPSVYEEIEREYQEQCRVPASPPLFVVEVPLLFESGSESQFDFVIAVVTSEELARSRFTASTQWQNEDFTYRMSRQIPPAEKARRADFVLYNYGSLELLSHEVKQIFHKLTGR